MRTTSGNSDPELIDSFLEQSCIQLVDPKARFRFDLKDVPKIELPRLTITVQDESYLEKKGGV